MRTVLGLSLDSDDVVWVLVDAADGSILDHDVLDIHTDAEVAGAAARGAHAIARTCGFEVDRIRLTWANEAARDGMRLRTRLGCLGFADVEAVPLACVLAVTLPADAADMDPGLAMAYGAALAVVSPSEAITVPVTQQRPAHKRRRRLRIASAVLGAAAAAAFGIVFLTGGAAPQVQPATTAADHSVPTDAGWAAVPAPSDAAANQVRKVVATPSDVEQPSVEPELISDAPEQSYEPVQAVTATEPEAAPEPPVEATVEAAPLAAELPLDAGAPHLPGPVADAPAAEPVVAPHLEQPAADAHLPVPAADPASVPLPGPEMTDTTNVFTAVP